MNGASLNPLTFIPMLLEEAKAKGEVGELSWVDAKQQWPDLKTEAGLMEFIKDVAALANGPQDGLLVFGISQRPFVVQEQPYSKSKYADNGQIEQLVNSKIFPRARLTIDDITWNNTCISYALVAQSHNRPHVVREWRCKPVPRRCPKCTQTTDMPGPTFRNAVFWRSGSTTCGPQTGEREYPDRIELDGMYADRPSSFGRLHVVADPQFQGFLGQKSGPLELRLPLSVYNVGNLGTSLCGLRLKGTLRREKGVGPDEIEILPAFYGSLHHLNDTYTLCPIYLAPGQGINGLIHTYLLATMPKPTTPWERQTYSLDCEVTAVDPLGTEWWQAISTKANQ
ncbi:MAG: putative DNA binding domain-containing protein [Planctomycetes bacterium]|nr:putative DNA binding domain-containing protein [Planctomycetota bacterium]